MRDSQHVEATSLTYSATPPSTPKSREQSELSVKVVAEDGSVVAGLAGWTWGTCAGISLVWVREDARRQGWSVSRFADRSSGC